MKQKIHVFGTKINNATGCWSENLQFYPSAHKCSTYSAMLMETHICRIYVIPNIVDVIFIVDRHHIIFHFSFFFRSGSRIVSSTFVNSKFIGFCTKIKILIGFSFSLIAFSLCSYHSLTHTNIRPAWLSILGGNRSWTVNIRVTNHLSLRTLRSLLLYSFISCLKRIRLRARCI